MESTFRSEWKEVRRRSGLWGRSMFLGRSVVAVVRLGIAEHMGSLGMGGGMVQAWKGVGSDVRVAVRSLRREPGFALTVVVALGLGIGLTTSAFSIVWGTLLRGLPFERPTELVHFERGDDERESLPVVPHDLVDWRAANRTFVDLAAFTEAVVVLDGDQASPERIYGSYIEPGAFALLEASPAMGRLLTAADDVPGAPSVVLLSDGLWRRRFDADPAIVGRDVRINDQPHTVVGVMPAGFGFPLSEELWLPLRLDLSRYLRGEGRLDVFGRLLPGVSLDEARADFARISASLAEAHPGSNAGIHAVLRSYTDEFVDAEFGSMVWGLFVAAALVLLVASLNVASLMVARGQRRARELAVRVSLGAGRARVAQHLLAEAGVLGVAAGLLGASLSWVGIGWFAGRGARPGTFQLAHGDAVPFWWDVRLDGASLAFVLVVTGAAVVIAGLLPAWRAIRTDPARLLREETRGGTARTGVMSRAVVVTEIALAGGVLSVAGLTGGSVIALSNVGEAVHTEGLVVGSIGLPDARLGGDEQNFPDLAARRVFWEALLERLATDPSVERVARATTTPFLAAGHQTFAVPEVAEGEPQSAATAFVDAAWFEMLGVEALEGRLISRDDRPGGEAVVVVNRSFADRWLNGAAVGRSIEVPGPDGVLAPARVVGVAPDLWMDGIQDRDPAGLYRPFAQAGAPNRTGVFDRNELRYGRLLVRAVPGASAVAALRGAVDELSPGLPVYGVATVDETLARAGGQYRLYGAYYLVFGAVALFMVLVGLYGLVAYTVGQREREIGIRVALGAAGASVVGLVLRRALWLVGGGLVGSWLLALWMRRAFALVLFRVEPGDPRVLAAVLTLLLVTTTLASLIPALRASRIDPLEAIRRE